MQDQARELAELEHRARRRASPSRSTRSSGSAGCRRFLPPQVADLIVAAGDHEMLLGSHRREVTVVFCDLRGFTAFAETAEPEEVMAVLARVSRRAWAR